MLSVPRVVKLCLFCNLKGQQLPDGRHRCCVPPHSNPEFPIPLLSLHKVPHWFLELQHIFVCLIITSSVICMCVPLLLDIYCLFVWGWTCRSVSDSRGNKAKRNRLCPTCVIECRWTLFLISAVTVNLRLKETQSLLCIPLVAHVAPPVVCRVHWLLLSSELLNTAVLYPNLPPRLSGFTFKFKYFIKPAAFKLMQLNNSINNQQFATFEASCS